MSSGKRRRPFSFGGGGAEKKDRLFNLGEGGGAAIDERIRMERLDKTALGSPADHVWEYPVQQVELELVENVNFYANVTAVLAALKSEWDDIEEYVASTPPLGRTPPPGLDDLGRAHWFSQKHPDYEWAEGLGMLSTASAVTEAAETLFSGASFAAIVTNMNDAVGTGGPVSGSNIKVTGVHQDMLLTARIDRTNTGIRVAMALGREHRKQHWHLDSSYKHILAPIILVSSWTFDRYGRLVPDAQHVGSAILKHDSYRPDDTYPPDDPRRFELKVNPLDKQIVMPIKPNQITMAGQRDIVYTASVIHSGPRILPRMLYGERIRVLIDMRTGKGQVMARVTNRTTGASRTNLSDAMVELKM